MTISLEELRTHPQVKRWMGQKKDSTAKSQVSSLKLFLEYVNKPLDNMIDEVIEDFKKDPRQRTDLLQVKLTEWGKQLVKDGSTAESARVRIMGVRSFFKLFGISLSMRIDGGTENQRMRLTPEKVKKLLDHASNLRDKAIMLTFFQSGLDVSGLTSLKYGHVIEGIENKEHPIKLDYLRRKKTGVQFYTFIGLDAIHAIEVYLDELKSLGVVLERTSPLFVRYYGKGNEIKPITKQAVEDMLKQVALKSGLITGKEKFNPVSCHAFRKSFSEILGEHGINPFMIDFWIAHEKGALGIAYRNYEVEGLRREYLKAEPYLSISNGNGEGLRGNISEVREQNTKLLETIANQAGVIQVLSTTINEIKAKLDDSEKTSEMFIQAAQSLSNRVNLLEKQIQNGFDQEQWRRVENEELEKELEGAKTEQEEEAIFRAHGYLPKGEKLQPTEEELEFVKRIRERMKEKKK